ncbi:17375_t:CDS:10 [Entrophospora sp. SA101]|nr:17375_t:CDS:10 [Entrophospora sp. SA101]CAJ0900628.1 7528_t:CDS:10 [Entrophospora sp. SA101]
MASSLVIDDITLNEDLEELELEWPSSDSELSDHKRSCYTLREVTARDAENGTDVQGINWDSFNVTRQRYREVRLKNYKNYENVQGSYDQIKEFYISNDDLFIDSSRINYWNSIMKKSKVALDLDQAFEISTIACRNNFLLVGLYGEFACRRLDAEPIHFGTVTTDANGITNHMDIIESRTGSTVAVISSNDKKSRIMDLASLKFIDTYDFEWAVNCTSVSPNRDLLCVVGDDTETMIVSSETGKVVSVLKGHIDYSFACCWSPNGRIIATGNQDKTTRLYDTRNMSKSFAVLGAKIGAVRSLQFSADGRYLSMAEPADFVHVFDAHTFERSQVFDLFGEIAGVTFTPDSEGLYIANADENYG